MEDEKNSCNDGCKCQEEPRSEPQYIPPYMLQGNGIVSNHGSFNVGIERDPDYDREPASPLKIDDLVIKQMDYGYLVKAGCQTLCVETKKNLITLFSEYINDPRRVRNLHDSNDLNRLYEEAEGDLEENLKRKISEIEKQAELQKQKNVIHIAVIGRSINDVKNYLGDILPLVVKGATALHKYMLETQDHIIYYYAISNVEHTRGLGFDKVVETHRARENREFYTITECIQINRRR